MRLPDPTPLLRLLENNLGAAAPYRDQNKIADLNAALDVAYEPDAPDAATLAGIYLHAGTTAWACQSPRSDAELAGAIAAVQITPERLQTVYGPRTPNILALTAAAATLYPALCERWLTHPVLNDATRTAYDHALAEADRAGIYRLDYARSAFDQARAAVERAAHRALVRQTPGIARHLWWHHTIDALRLATAALSTTGLISQAEHDALTAPARRLFTPDARDLFEPCGYKPPAWEQIINPT